MESGGIEMLLAKMSFLPCIEKVSPHLETSKDIVIDINSKAKYMVRQQRFVYSCLLCLLGLFKEEKEGRNNLLQESIDQSYQCTSG